MIPLLFSIASITHLLVLYFVPDEVVFKLGSKILPILILIFLYFFRGNWKDKAGRFIFAGLIFSLFGDSFLALPGNYFVFGLGSFLMAQILYSIGFSIGNPVHLIRSIPFFAFGIFFYAWIFPGSRFLFTFRWRFISSRFVQWVGEQRLENVPVQHSGNP